LSIAHIFLVLCKGKSTVEKSRIIGTIQCFIVFPVEKVPEKKTGGASQLAG
jgi:hypothetical protein